MKHPKQHQTDQEKNLKDANCTLVSLYCARSLASLQIALISLIFFVEKQSREHDTNITLVACEAIVLTVCSLLEYITFKEEPIVLRVLRMISSTERNVYA